MEEYCQNPLCENEAVKEVPVSVEKPSDQVRSLCAACEEVYTWGVQHGTVFEGLKIDPPPEEMGDEPLFRVVYMIDVNSGDVREAAEYTHRIMTDPDSLRPVLHVVDHEGNIVEIDLSEDSAGPDDIGKTANYGAAAQYLADQGKLLFTGPVNGGLWNARCMDASIMSKEQGDKAAYEFLVKFGDQYASDLSADQQRQWQTIKDTAALRLKGDLENTGEVQQQPVTDTFTKTTAGFVAQTFEKNHEGRFVCTHQEFIAGDQCDYEDAKGNPIEAPDYEYQPYNMALKTPTQSEVADNDKLSKAYEAIEDVLESLRRRRRAVAPVCRGNQNPQGCDRPTTTLAHNGKYQPGHLFETGRANAHSIKEISMSDKNRQFALVVDRRELATILAALRFYQDENLRSGSDVGREAIKDIATDCGSLRLLDFEGVDHLCERINTCYEKSSLRRRKDWVLIVTDRAEVVHVRAYKGKAAAEKGLFRYLREEHDYDGGQSMGAVGEWIEEKAERLNVDIVQQDIRSTTDWQ